MEKNKKKIQSSKGLIMKGHPRGYEFVPQLVSLFLIDDGLSQLGSLGVRVLIADPPDILSKESFAVVKVSTFFHWRCLLLLTFFFLFLVRSHCTSSDCLHSSSP